LITAGEDVREVRYCDVDPGEPQLYNVVTVALSQPLPERAFAARSVVGASCGTCGKTSIEQVRLVTAPVPQAPAVSISTLVELPAALRGTQSVFDRTGGLHAAGHARPDGDIVAVREDVGRHNAVDKLVGASLLSGPAIEPGDVLVLSGRVSFEMVQKAVLARFGLIVAVSAPSSLAISAADELGVTLLGFTRNGQANVYSHKERVTFDA
jgi:FdhD protein